MSFRKRGSVIGNATRNIAPAPEEKILPPGVRSSPLDSRPTISTGTHSLNQILAGHAGLPTGSSLLIEENGNTDFGGVLLRHYAAQGAVQGDHVHVLGFHESWRRQLPGLMTETRKSSTASNYKSVSQDRMKIAWRYESLSNNSGPSQGTLCPYVTGSIHWLVCLMYLGLDALLTSPSASSRATSVFTNTFDLSSRLDDRDIKGTFHFSSTDNSISSQNHSLLDMFLAQVTKAVSGGGVATMHRVVIPSLMAPALYESSCSLPQRVLKFVHGLRALLRRFPAQLTAVITLPTSLHPRTAGHVRWIELLSDCVLELIPFQYRSRLETGVKSHDKAQGLLRTHTLPGYHERGGGLVGNGVREDLSFKLSGTEGLVILPAYLPPVDNDGTITDVLQESSAKGSKTLAF